MTKEELQLIISGDSRGATSAIGATGKAVGTFADGTVGHFRRVAGSVLNLQNLIVAGAATMAAKAVFDPAIEMETFETQFTTLLGSVDAAKARLADLSQFAESTPFELPELARASRILQTLTKGALASGPALRMVGDVAASVGQPVDELAIWFGRLYDGIQSGRPVGEAMARLQEMGVVSGDVRGKIEALQKTGAAGTQVWQVVTTAMAAYTGGMELLSKTTAGKLSTLRDNWKALRRDVGEAALPALNAAIDATMAKLEEFKESGKAADLGRALAATIGGLVELVTFIGRNAETLRDLGLTYAAVKIWTSATAAIAAYRAALAAAAVQAAATQTAVGGLNTTIATTPGLLSKIGAIGVTAWAGWNVGKLIGELLGVEESMERILRLHGLLEEGKYSAEGLGNALSDESENAFRRYKAGIAAKRGIQDVGGWVDREWQKHRAMTIAKRQPRPARSVGAPDTPGTPAPDALAAAGPDNKRLAEAIAEHRRLLAEWEAAVAQEKRIGAAQDEVTRHGALADAGDEAVAKARDLVAEYEVLERDAKKAADAAWDALLNPKTRAEKRAEKDAAREQAKLERSLSRAQAREADGLRVSKRGRELIEADKLRQKAAQVAKHGGDAKDALATAEAKAAAARTSLTAANEALAAALPRTATESDRLAASMAALRGEMDAIHAAGLLVPGLPGVPPSAVAGLPSGPAAHAGQASPSSAIVDHLAAIKANTAALLKQGIC